MALKKNKKLIIISPNCWCCNKFLEKYFFDKKYYFVKNNFLSFILIPLTFINFIRFSIYNEKLFFNQKQYYSNLKEKIYNMSMISFLKNSSHKTSSEQLNLLDISISEIRKSFLNHLNFNLKKKIMI